MTKVMRSNTPTTSCLATVIDDSGQLMPIIPGMALFIITDPAHPELALPTTLQKVTTGCITLRIKTIDGAIQDYEYILQQKQLRNKEAVARFKRGSH